MFLPTENRSYPAFREFHSPHQVRSLLEQGSGPMNEDVLFADCNLFGVFDGATSLGDELFVGGLTGGLLAARTAAQTFQGSDQALDRLAEEANRRIDALQANCQAGRRERHQLWSTSLAVVRLIGNQLEYCQTGDAVILLVQNDGDYRLLTPAIDIDRETLSAWKDMQVAPDTPIQVAMAEQIRQVREQMNISYGVLNGEPEALNFLCHGYENLDKVSDILLFTDGLHLPRENPEEEQDWQPFVELYLQGGLSAVRDHVRQLQQRDPACRQYPRFKMHDDIAAVAISC